MTYLVILSDSDDNIDWRHPMEVEATSKIDAKNAIAESCPPENIKKVLTVDEYKAFMSNKGNIARMKVDAKASVSSDNFNSGKEFFASMLKAAEEQNETPEYSDTDTNTVAEKQTTVETSKTITAIPRPNIAEAVTPKYFTDNGIMFKLENGVLYKKCWETVSLVETTDEATGNVVLPEYRIINAETGKVFKSDKYTVQHLVWKELNKA